jgi:hypothetical protein
MAASIPTTRKLNIIIFIRVLRRAGAGGRKGEG